MSSSTASVTHTDAQTWVYPPPGAPTPPIAKTGNFGPVHLNDEMILQWSPSTQPDEIYYVCFSQSGDQSQWAIASHQSQPLTFQFANQATQQNSSDLLFCHMYFSPSYDGNTVVWQFLNQPGDEIVTWHGNSAPTTASTTISSALSTSTGTTSLRSSATATKSSAATSNSSSGSSSGSGGLSTGATAGIAVGAVVAVLAICAAIFFFWRSRRLNKQRDQGQGHDQGWNQHSQQQPPYSDQGEGKMRPMRQSYLDGNARHEAPGNYEPVELAGNTSNENKRWTQERPGELP